MFPAAEDSPPFCADSLEQYYSWNIGKRRAAEVSPYSAPYCPLHAKVFELESPFAVYMSCNSPTLHRTAQVMAAIRLAKAELGVEAWCPVTLLSQLQRAVAVKRLVQDVLEKSPGLQASALPKTREVVQWCRQRGYTPPDPEPQRSEEDSIEDILTQIDSEPGESVSSALGGGGVETQTLCMKGWGKKTKNRRISTENQAGKDCNATHCWVWSLIGLNPFLGYSG